MGSPSKTDKMETFVLVFPLFFLVPLLLEMSGFFSLSSTQMRTGNFLAKIIFLNHVHVYFTLALFVLVPDVRNWLAAKSKATPLYVERAIAVFVGIFLIYYFALPWLQSQSGESPATAVKLIAATAAVVALHHNYSQTLGLSLSFGREFEPVGRTAVFEKFERYLCYAMIVAHAVQVYSASLFPMPGIAQRISGYALTCAAIGVLIVAAIFPARYLRKKIYMIRYLFYPFIPFSFVALLAVLSFHGVEYFYVSRRLHNASAANGRSLSDNRNLLLVTVAIVILTTLAIFGRSGAGYWPVDLLAAQPGLVLFLSSLSLSFSFLHYHLDSQMFKMSDPIARETIGRHLFGAPKLSGD